MSFVTTKRAVVFLALATSPLVFAEHDPIHERHELMEDVGKAAKPIGMMFRGERDYDVEVVMASLATWKDVGERFGELFPEGTESGGDTEAAPTIWSDREGFNEALSKWRDATDTAIAARPETLEDAKPTVGAVFNTCKNCHDNYRIDDE